MASDFDIKVEIERVHAHRNSINAIESTWSGAHPLRPLMSMLAHIGYVLCDVLEALGEQIIEEESDGTDTLEETR